MRRLLYLSGLSMVLTLLIAPSALAQQGPECPPGEVNVLTDDGFICMPENIGDQTPAETDAATNDPRPNAETPIVENQDVTPAAEDPATGGGLCPEGQFPATAPGDPGEGTLVCFATQEEADVYSETGEIPGEEATPAADTGDAVLPDTGGVSLFLLPAAGLLVATGLIGLRVARHRS